MKLIGVNTGRRIISYQDTSLGVAGPSQLATAGKIVLDKNGGALVSGAQTYGQQGIYIGSVNGVPMMSLGSPAQGMTWDGKTLNIIGTLIALAATISGDVNVGIGGDIRSGMTAYDVGTGWWLEYNGGTPRAAMGNPSGSHWTWDGSSFKIYNGSGTLVFDSSGLNGSGVNFNQDNVGAGATWSAIHGSELTSGQVDPSKAGNANAQTQYIGAVTGTQRNMIPDSGFKSTGVYWTDVSGGKITVTPGGYDGAANAFIYVGTGAASGNLYQKSKAVPVAPGTYTLSCKFGVANVTSGHPQVAVFDPTVTTQYGFINGTSNGRLSGSITIPGGATSAVFLMHTNNCTVTNGAGLYWEQPQFEPGSAMTAWNEATGDDVSGSLLVDAGNSGHIGTWNLDNRVSDGSTYARALSSDMTSNRVDFSKSLLNKQLDNIPDGSTYARIKGSELSSGVHKLTVAASGAQNGDARNIRGAVASGVSQGFYWSGLTISAPSPTQINVSAATLLMGGSGTGNVSYNSSSVTGLTASTLYYVYYIDPGYAGGTQTLHATTNKVDLAGNKDIVFIGSWTTPASGSGGSGGASGCLHELMSVGIRRDGVLRKVLSRDICVGDEVRSKTGEWVPVLEVEHQPHDGWIEVSADAHMHPSISAFVTETQPFYTPEGDMVRARDVTKGMVLASRNGPATVFHVGASRNGAALKVIIKIPPPHLFYAGEDGFMLHNGNPKP